MKLNNIPRYICNPKLAFNTFRLKYNNRYAIEKLWKERMDFPLDLDNPKRLTEKQQWLKLHDHKKIYTTFADKYRLKEWVKQNIGENYTVPTLATFSNVDEINFETLPKSFVIKCNHDSGSVFICHDKEKGIFISKEKKEVGWDAVKDYLRKALHKQYYYESREWPYKHIKRLILVEPILITKEGGLPHDIKLFYANGEYLFTYVHYYKNEIIVDRCMYDENWNRLPFIYTDSNYLFDGINSIDVPRPMQYDKMLEVGAKIAVNCTFCRVDFYDMGDDIKIGEVTFYHGGGFDRFFPDKYDAIYGEKLKLNMIKLR